MRREAHFRFLGACCEAAPTRCATRELLPRPERGGTQNRRCCSRPARAVARAVRSLTSGALSRGAGAVVFTTRPPRDGAVFSEVTS